MRTRAGLIIMVVMLLVVISGCTILAVDQQITYRTVLLGPISARIPENLERSREGLFGESYQDIPEGMTLYAYDVASGEIGFTIAETDLRKMQESQGQSWGGWEVMEEIGITKDIIAEYVVGNTLRNIGVYLPTRQVTRQLVVDGKEAWELQYTSEFMDERVNYHFLVIFGDGYIWTVIYSVKEEAWGKYEGSWEVIRDSVKLNLVD